MPNASSYNVKYEEQIYSHKLFCSPCEFSIQTDNLEIVLQNGNSYVEESGKELDFYSYSHGTEVATLFSSDGMNKIFFTIERNFFRC